MTPCTSHASHRTLRWKRRHFLLSSSTLRCYSHHISPTTTICQTDTPPNPKYCIDLASAFAGTAVLTPPSPYPTRQSLSFSFPGVRSGTIVLKSTSPYAADIVCVLRPAATGHANQVIGNCSSIGGISAFVRVCKRRDGCDAGAGAASEQRLPSTAGHRRCFCLCALVKPANESRRRQ
jgi:hypothetical protein